MVAYKVTIHKIGGGITEDIKVFADKDTAEINTYIESLEEIKKSGAYEYSIERLDYNKLLKTNLNAVNISIEDLLIIAREEIKNKPDYL